jgi:glycine reductase
LDDLTAEAYEAHHSGYDTRSINADPDRALPLDMARELEKEGAFAVLHDYFYTLAGQGTYVESARMIGESLAEELKKERIDAVILVST